MPATPHCLDQIRLPRWLLPDGWPTNDDEPAPARLTLENGRIAEATPVSPTTAPVAGAWNLQGTLALPGLIDAHTHLDKVFTLRRMKDVRPGLLGAIEAMMTDRANWTPADVRARAERGLQWAWESGSTRVRTHVDWWEPDAVPMAWPVMAELAAEWRGRVMLEQVSLIKLGLFENAEDAMHLARIASETGPQALLGGFVHSTNFSETALRNLLTAAQAFDLDVDLHVDEELNAEAVGLATTARLLRDIGFEGRVVCGHTCALAAQDEPLALATLDAVARSPITLISLPATNLLLQDAVTGRTPRQRGLTLVKEARDRGIPLLFASDNVQDPFCRLGSFDPIEALATGALVAQLGATFDDWSQTVCRADWLQRTPASAPQLIGTPADLVLFPEADIHGWPSRSATRVVLRDGRVVRGAPPPAWTEPPIPSSF